jgi:hypothetical protein
MPTQFHRVVQHTTDHQQVAVASTDQEVARAVDHPTL